jgi:hypothetical protein
MPGEADEQQGVGGDGGGGPGEEAVESVCAVAGKLHLVGDLGEDGLDAVAPFGDDFQQPVRHAEALFLVRRDEHGSAAGGLVRGELAPVEAFVGEQVPGHGSCFQQVGGDVPLVYRSGNQAPGADNAAPRSVLAARR